MNTLALSAEGVGYIVLDEADKMLSLGLEPQLRRLRKLLIPSKSPAEPVKPPLVLSKQNRPQVSPSLHPFTVQIS